MKSRTLFRDFFLDKVQREPYRIQKIEALALCITGNYLFLRSNQPIMKKILFTTLSLCWMFMQTEISAQSLSPQVIATTGGYTSNAAGSLSYTVGETVIQTLSTGSHTLTQGFQQPFEMQLNLKAYLQGYYVGGGQMTDVLYNQGVYGSPSTVSDSITVALHEQSFPFNLAFQTTLPINQDGTVTVRGLGNMGQSYYVVLRSRNHVETWSASPITLNHNTSYDFSSGAAQAYGGNQAEVETGIYAMYAGDIVQDLVVDAFDYIAMDSDLIVGAFGYLNTDLTGDGVVDAFDYVILDANLVAAIGAVTP